MCQPTVLKNLTGSQNCKYCGRDLALCMYLFGEEALQAIAQARFNEASRLITRQHTEVHRYFVFMLLVVKCIEIYQLCFASVCL